MAVIERHRSTFDILTGRNTPAARSPHAPVISVGKPDYAIAKPNFESAKKTSSTWLFAVILAAIVICTVAVALVIDSAPRGALPSSTKVLAALKSISYVVYLLALAAVTFFIRYLISRAVKNTASSIWKSLSTSARKAEPERAPQPAKAGHLINRAAGTIGGLFAINVFLLPIGLSIIRGLGLRGLTGPITLAVTIAFIWYRHSKDIAAALKQKSS